MPRTVVFLSLVFGNFQAIAAERFELKEPPGDTRTWRVNARLKVDGTLTTPAIEGKTNELSLKVDGTFTYSERRLPGAGRDAKALRSARRYESASASIQVNGDRSSARLRDLDKLVVAHGRREGIQFYRPGGDMTRDELELLQFPGDSLPVMGLLPRTPVEVGDYWDVESWVTQMLTATEAVLKSELKCTLESVEDDKAKVKVEGTIEGAVQGANTEIDITGHYIFDVKREYVTIVKLKQVERRGVGAVSPGMQVTATVDLNRAIDTKDKSLAKVADDLPLEPQPADLMLSLQLPGNSELAVSRDWHLFQRSEKQTVLRLVQKGGLVAQCNLSPLPPAEAGGHLKPDEFKQDVRKTLGDKLKKIESADELDAKGGRFLYRVVATGTGQKDVELTWHYYLVADPGGKQFVVVFAFDSKQSEKFEGEGRRLVDRLKIRG